MVHSALHVRVVCGIVYEKVSVLHVMYRIYTFIQGTLTFCSMALRQKPACIFWGAEGAPILFSDLGLRMASCSYIQCKLQYTPLI